MPSSNNNKNRLRVHGPETVQSTVAFGSTPSILHNNVISGEVKLDERTMGEIRHDGVLQKHIAGSKHNLRKHNAICFDVSLLITALRREAHSAEVHDDETGRVYHITLAEILAKAIRIFYAGEQLALPIPLWRSGAVTEPPARQLSCFGGTP